MQIQINKAHFPVTVLGPGRRIGLWLQGCSIRCKGCISQDTWDADPGRAMPLNQLLQWCRQVTKGQAWDGVTISGGEPFDQPQALGALLEGLHRWRQRARLDFDVLCYSGYPLDTLQRRHAGLLRQLDALIPEPFVQALEPAQRWRGSSNQTLVTFSARGQTRYAPHLTAPLEPSDKRMQMQLDGQRLWTIGIPARGDMQALQTLCERQGLAFKDVSWRQ